jgi:Ca2+/Na+ antiporter
MVLRNKFREFVPIVLLFVIINALAIAAASRLTAWNISQDVLIGGNLFLFAITFFSFLIAERGLQNKTPNAFMRSVYGSIMFKMFLAIIAAFIYIAINKKGLNKAALFICMGLYLIYTFVEVSILTRMLRRKPNE